MILAFDFEYEPMRHRLYTLVLFFSCNYLCPVTVIHTPYIEIGEPCHGL